MSLQWDHLYCPLCTKQKNLKEGHSGKVAIRIQRGSVYLQRTRTNLRGPFIPGIHEVLLFQFNYVQDETPQPEIVPSLHVTTGHFIVLQLTLCPTSIFINLPFWPAQLLTADLFQDVICFNRNRQDTSRDVVAAVNLWWGPVITFPSLNPGTWRPRLSLTGPAWGGLDVRGKTATRATRTGAGGWGMDPGFRSGWGRSPDEMVGTTGLSRKAARADPGFRTGWRTCPEILHDSLTRESSSWNLKFEDWHLLGGGFGLNLKLNIPALSLPNFLDLLMLKVHALEKWVFCQMGFRNKKYKTQMLAFFLGGNDRKKQAWIIREALYAHTHAELHVFQNANPSASCLSVRPNSRFCYWDCIYRRSLLPPPRLRVIYGRTCPHCNGAAQRAACLRRP